MAYFEVGVEYEYVGKPGTTYTVTSVGRKGDLVYARRSKDGVRMAIAIVGHPEYEGQYVRVNDEASYIPEDWS